MNKDLEKFSTSRLETELLSRKKCEFNKRGCHKQATGQLIKQLNGWKIQRNPICDNCLQKIKNYFAKKRKNHAKKA